MGQQLFHGPSVEHVLAAQQAVLGRIPERMVRSSATRNLYFTRACCFKQGVHARSSSEEFSCAALWAASGHLYTLDPQGYPAGAYRILPVQMNLSTLLEMDDVVCFSGPIFLYAMHDPRALTCAFACVRVHEHS